jgi:hypothetical protein
MAEDTLTTRIWISTAQESLFPEQQEPYAARLAEQPNIGFCFSGGGTRALSAAMGQLRGLIDIDVLKHARYISSVSGGTWACALFTYYPSGPGLPQNDAEFLGPVTPPGEITTDGLKQMPETRLGYVATLSLRNNLLKLVENRDPSDRLWLDAVGLTFFQNFDLYDPEKPAYFSLDQGTVQEIREANPQLQGAPFHTVRTESYRPFLVMNSCLVGPNAVAPFTSEQLVPFEYTPLAVGSAHPLEPTFTSRKKNKASETRLVGGGFVQPFAFGGNPSSQAPEGCTPATPPNACALTDLPATPRPYTLADAAGTSSSAAAGSLDQFGLTDQLGAQALYWPVTAKADPPVEEFDFGDGGSLENFGVLSLLQRKVERLVVFINTPTPLNLDYDPAATPTGKDVDSNLPPLFGYPIGVHIHNQVFPQSDWPGIISSLQDARRAGKTVLAQTEHEVQANDWWGIEGGWKARVLWFYLDRVPDWESQLKWSIQAQIKMGNTKILGWLSPYRHFPNYATIDENALDLVELTPRQVNLLADLTCWTITENQDTIRKFLS